MQGSLMADAGVGVAGKALKVGKATGSHQIAAREESSSRTASHAADSSVRPQLPAACRGMAPPNGSVRAISRARTRATGQQRWQLLRRSPLKLPDGPLGAALHGHADTHGY
jgi:hypothetical protein